MYRNVVCLPSKKLVKGHLQFLGLRENGKDVQPRLSTQTFKDATILGVSDGNGEHSTLTSKWVATKLLRQFEGDELLYLCAFLAR